MTDVSAELHVPPKWYKDKWAASLALSGIVLLGGAGGLYISGERTLNGSAGALTHEEFVDQRDSGNRRRLMGGVLGP